MSCDDIISLEEIMYDNLEIPFEAIAIEVKLVTDATTTATSAWDEGDIMPAAAHLNATQKLVWGWADDTMNFKQYWRKALISPYKKGLDYDLVHLK